MAIIAVHELPTDPLDALHELARGEIELERLCRDRISSARAAGATWEQIGAALGITRQAAREFFTRNAGAALAGNAIRVRFTGLRGALVRKPMDSRLRGNDINGIFSVIPAKAGMIVRTAPTGTPPSVIPAKAGIHTACPNTNAVARAASGCESRVLRIPRCPDGSLPM